MAISVREALRKAREAFRPPSFYLDTNVIRDLMRARRQASIELFDLLKDKKWLCIASYFTYMELFDIEQEARFFQTKLDDGMEINRILSSRSTRDLTTEALQRIEAEIYEVAEEKCGFVEYLYLDEDGWKQAIDLASKSNLPAADCIHLATALIGSCDVLVTSDTHLSTVAKAYIASGPAEEVLKEIASITPASPLA